MITYRKTKSGTWVTYGPVAEFPSQLPATVSVTKKSGERKAETVESLGRSFVANGIEMVYGYLGETLRPAAHLRPSRQSSQMCDNCDEYRAIATATDMSGISGRVCRRCARDGALSFA